MVGEGGSEGGEREVRGLIDDDFPEDEFENSVANALENELNVLR